MTDNRTREYFRDIVKQNDERTHEILKVGGPCRCAECMAKRYESIRDSILGDRQKGNFIPELSPNYNPNTRMLEFSGRPVGTFGSKNNTNRIATKWSVND